MIQQMVAPKHGYKSNWKVSREVLPLLLERSQIFTCSMKTASESRVLLKSATSCSLLWKCDQTTRRYTKPGASDSEPIIISSNEHSY